MTILTDPPLTHSAADIIRHALIAEGVGSLPAVGSVNAWPLYVASEPDSPDEAMTLQDTTGTTERRTQPDGSEMVRHGVQLRVRATTYAQGYVKAAVVRDALLSVLDRAVPIDGVDYLLHCLVGVGSVLTLGREQPSSRRWLFTLNFLAVISLD